MKSFIARLLTMALLVTSFTVPSFADSVRDFGISITAAKTVTISSTSLPGNTYVVVRIFKNAGTIEYMNQYLTSATGGLNESFQLSCAVENNIYTTLLSIEGITQPLMKSFVYSAASGGGSTPNEDNDGGSTSDSSQTTVPVIPVVPTPPTGTELAQQATTIAAKTENLSDAAIGNTIKEVDQLIGKIESNEQAIAVLNNFNTIINDLSTKVVAAADQKNYETLATQLTLGTEQKLSIISKPEDQLAVLVNLVDATKVLQTSLVTQNTQINQSITQMLQNTANNYGTTQILVEKPEQPILVETKVIQDVIAKQVEGLKQLNELQQRFFDVGTNKTLKPEVKLEIQTPKDSKEMKLTLSQEVVGILKNQKIETISIKNQNVEIKFPVTEFKTTQTAQVVIEQTNIPPSRNTLDAAPKAVYEFYLLVDNEKKLKFSKPLTLSFDLTVFGMENDDSNALSIQKFNQSTQMWNSVGGIVDPEMDTIFVTRDTLSQYTVLKSKKSFTDADQSWAKAEINAMLNKGIVSEEAKFEPQSLLTRGEFAEWIANAYGLKVSDKSLPFKDVPKGSEYYNAIAAVYQQGILQGSKDKFNPNKALTQNELAAALGKVLVSFDNKQKSDKVTSKHLSSLKTTQVASWAEDDMALLMELGLSASASNGGANITKEAAASAFMKFYRS